ncbi:PH domain-containing protein [Niabella drilacis]|uniref:PH domain-containing protein n=1 Tax=Niabella drilacis (strain DSM 25811 / CCM 8410 / CCUG 62505 / LMG 26954 / E90) TaxID=1285928 RepID=A0A1G6SD95_NIADE|nr:PH domain-containing protein [Niabella drilacis]SDD14641.1 PH domain-containing protein [Niabella drilacis]
MDFSASYDRTTKTITTLVAVLMLAVLTSMWFSLKAAGTWLSLSFMAVVSFLAVLMPYGFSVKKYQLSNEELVICRPFGNKHILLTTLRSAVVIDPKLLRWSWRIFGSGGMFGYYGNFSNRQLGTMKWFMTRKDTAVLIETEQHKKIVISPDDPEGFVNTFKMFSSRA